MDVQQISLKPITSCSSQSDRASAATLNEQYTSILQDGLAVSMLQAIPGYAMLINRQRQIVAVNSNVLTITGAEGIDQLIGKRPGEALNCSHACDAPGGCGTGPYCTVCGAVLAIVESQDFNQQAVNECHITLTGPEETVLDLRATATPVEIRGERYIMLVLQDISSEKRRDVLERVFFHDVINTAGCIHGLASLLFEHDDISAQLEVEYKKWLVSLSDTLLDEIHSQRKLLDAENGQFVPELAPFSVRLLLSEVYQLYHHYEKTPGRLLVILDGPDFIVNSDVSIIRRVIGNMTLNALEASSIGDAITISAFSENSRVVIEVHNHGEISHDIKLKLFKRSFSTKSASGRGIGTYSMKLFGERYLNGKVSFRSTAEEGTVFSLSLPLDL